LRFAYSTATAASKSASQAALARIALRYTKFLLPGVDLLYDTARP
jgi:hypothetical protein